MTARSIGGEQYGEFLIAVFDEWVRRDVGRVFVQIFDVALGVWSGQPSTLCVFAETCGDALALEHNGDLFSCDHFVDPATSWGTSPRRPSPSSSPPKQQPHSGGTSSTACRATAASARVRFACNGGCPKDRLLIAPDGEPGLNFLCEGFRAFFAHIDRPMRIMADLLRQRRPPSLIVETGPFGP